jgi:hypothetical protein
MPQIPDPLNLVRSCLLRVQLAYSNLMPLYNADVPVSFGDRNVDSGDANVSLSG